MEGEQVLVGGDPSPNSAAVVLVEEEDALAAGTPVRVDGMRRSRVGDRGEWYLTAGVDPEFPAYALVNAQGRCLFDDDRVLGGDRSDALAHAVGRLEPGQLRDAITATAGSISRSPPRPATIQPWPRCTTPPRSTSRRSSRSKRRASLRFGPGSSSGSGSRPRQCRSR